MALPHRGSEEMDHWSLQAGAVAGPASGEGSACAWSLRRSDTEWTLHAEIPFPEVVRWNESTNAFERLSPDREYTMYAALWGVSDPGMVKVSMVAAAGI